MADDFRARILAMIAQYPGLHVRELARQLDASQARVAYHIPIMVGAGAVEERRTDGALHLFAKGDRLKAHDRDVLALLRRPLPLQIVLQLLDEPGLRHAALASSLGLGKSKLSFHLKKMVELGIVDLHDGVQLIRPNQLRKLLEGQRATPDLRTRFADMWESFYG